MAEVSDQANPSGRLSIPPTYRRGTMSSYIQLLTQSKYNLITFRREPASAFFTVILPVIFLVTFTSIFGNNELEGGRRVATFYVPSILALAIISATLVNLAITVTSRRETGVLKRVRATPLEPWVYVAAQAVAGVAISLVMSGLLIGIGNVVFGVTVQSVTIFPLVISIFVGAMSFSAMGLALTALIPSEQAAPAVTNAAVLPLYFISDIFIIGEDSVSGIPKFIASLFPIKHLAAALSESFDPFATSTPWPVGHWLVVLLWGAIGTGATLLTFRWTPRR